MITHHKPFSLFAAVMSLVAPGAHAASKSAALPPYKILNSAQTEGIGGIDYVYADAPGRRLYIPRGTQVLVFNLDTLAPAGTIPNVRAHGAVVDPLSGHGFSSSSPVAMWNAKTLAVEKTIEVQGRPDGIFFESATEQVYVLSHAAPNVTALDGKTGAILAAFDIGGAPEQAASDGQGRVYIDVEDKNNVAVVDAKTHGVLAHYGLGESRTPAGLALDAKNNILFVFCREPQNCVVLNAKDGTILATLPIGKGTDGGGFNPETMEAFSSQGDGTLTIIKEESPTSFVVAQTLATKPRAKTCTLDAKTNHIILIATESLASTATATVTPTPTPSPAPSAAAAPGRGRGGPTGPAYLDILVVGR